MSEPNTPDKTDYFSPPPPGQCQSCQSQEVLPGYPAAICSVCRQQLIRFPIPTWIWMFAAGILGLMAIGLAEMPKYLNAARDLARGEKAYEEHRYRSAEAYLLRVVDKFPDHVEANGMLMVAALTNGHFELIEKPQAKLQHHKFQTNDELYQRITAALEQATYDLAPDDTSYLQQIRAQVLSGEDAERLYHKADSAMSSDATYVGLLAADILYEEGAYVRSNVILEKILAQRPEWKNALSLMIANKRNLGDYEGALKICRELQVREADNPEIPSMQARVELKRKQDAAARTYAEAAIRLDSTSVAALESMAMVEHFEGNNARSRQRLDRIAMLEPATGDSTITVRLRGLLDGTKSYR